MAHSHGESQSLESFWQALPGADRKERRWLEGPSITADDLKNGSATVVLCSSADWWRAAKSQGQGQGQERGERGQGQSSRPAGVQRGGDGGGQGAGPVMWFGKYRQRPLAVVQEDDPHYFRWACAEVGGFEQAARKAGLLEDSDSP